MTYRKFFYMWYRLFFCILGMEKIIFVYTAYEQCFYISFRICFYNSQTNCFCLYDTERNYLHVVQTKQVCLYQVWKNYVCLYCIWKKIYAEYRQLFLSTLCIQKFPHEIYIKILLPIPYIYNSYVCHVKKDLCIYFIETNCLYQVKTQYHSAQSIQTIDC